ncbi:MAG: aminopeptidase [Firmicutes bacterium]|nr:aminopeptidase [Bacillota bacterium]
MENRTAWEKYGKKDLKDLERVSEGYKKYLDEGKTERECVNETIAMAKAAGYVDLDEALKKGAPKEGGKYYAVCMGKTLALFRIGKGDLENGMNILGAHIDSPRLDVKQNPLYESDGLAYLDTHYYGGIKKYQWITQPMAIHGVAALKDGSVKDVCIGEDESDPVFCFTDLLIHLSADRQQKKASEVITGEGLDLLIGNRPLEKTKLAKDEKEAVKANVLAFLKEKYGMEEADLLSAELEIVPAGKARDCGLDRSMILAYGQDDRVCAYTSVLAMLEETGKIEKTACCLIVDKEEIGSVGATGMTSLFFENTVAKMMTALGKDSYSATRNCLANSSMLSSDVSAGFDPLYPEAYEKRSAAFLARGLAFNKFTGARGKSGSNDANAEYVAKIRRIMDDADVSFQFCELGKVDVGGGGTIAYIMAVYCMNVIDSGVAVLSMHAPYEVTSKADVYEAYKGYRAFLLNA